MTLTLFAIYLATMLPGLGFTGDTAKFQFIGKVLGIPHEPGYPIYVVLNWLWVNLLPIGSPAWKANFLSTALAMATCLILFATLRSWVGFTASTIGVLCLALSKQFWINAGVAEVYTLATLFLSVIIWSTLQAARTKEVRWLAVALFTWGLSLGHHPLVVPSIIAVTLVWRLGQFPEKRPGLLASALFVGTILGLGSYAFLFIRSAVPDIPFSEFRVHSLSDLLFSASGGKFHSNMASTSLGKSILVRFPQMLEHVFNQLGPALILVLVGLRATPRPIRDMVGVLVGTNLLIYMLYDISDIEVYLVPTAQACSIMAAFGVQRILEGRIGRPLQWRVWALTLVPLILFAANFGVANHRRPNQKVEELNSNLLGIEGQAVVWEHHYVGRMYSLYILLAEDPQEGEDIFVSGVGADAMRLYLAQSGSLVALNGSRPVPPGLPVFVFTEISKKRATAAGFEVGADGRLSIGAGTVQ